MKRVLLVNRPGGAFGYITDGWINALRDRGHVVARWDGLEESWFDFAPDLYIGCSGHKQPIPKQRSAMVAIHVNPYGPTKISGIDEPDSTISWVVNQKPHIVFGYGTEEDRILWSYWTINKGIKWVPMPVAGDKTIYKKSAESDRKLDMVYLGGRWAYKGITIDQYLIPLIYYCKNNGLDFRVHGWGDWPKDLRVETLADDNVNGFLGSGKVGPCISEKHTYEYGIDIPERAFKLALCGTLVVHDTVPNIRSMIPSALVAANADNFRDLAIHYSKPELTDERNAISQAQNREVLLYHTYHHRMATLFEAVGWEDEAIGMLKD
jgi:hypothetical protein